jgi:flagellar basal body-associated protein FliL
MRTDQQRVLAILLLIIAVALLMSATGIIAYSFAKVQDKAFTYGLCRISG